MESPFLPVGKKARYEMRGRLIENRITVFIVVISMLCMVGLRPQSPHNFAWKISVQLLQTLKSPYVT